MAIDNSTQLSEGAITAVVEPQRRLWEIFIYFFFIPAQDCDISARVFYVIVIES